MTWLDNFTWPRQAISDLQRDVTALRMNAGHVNQKLDLILKEINIMGAREDAAYAKLTDDIQKVKDGWAALQAQNAALVADNQTLRDALAAADATQAAAVESALTADSETDAGKVEAADSALAALVAPAPPVEG